MMLLNNADILYELFTVELKYDAKICCQEVSEKTMHLLNHKKSVMSFHQFSFASCKQTVRRKCKNAFNLKNLSVDSNLSEFGTELTLLGLRSL